MQPDISSVSNARVKGTIRLKESRVRRKENLFLIDGVREILRAQASGIELVDIFMSVERFAALQAASTTLPGNRHDEELRTFIQSLNSQGIRIWTVSDTVFDKMTFGDRNEGILATARSREPNLAELAARLPSHPLIGILEGIEKPGNIGAVYRSADGAGVDGVILISTGTDLYNPNTIRASLGTIFHVPTAIAEASEAIQWLLDRDIQIAAALCDGACSYTKVDYRRSTAIVLGSEADGLTPIWSDPSVVKGRSFPVRLPMLGIADSLNISNAAAILFYEARRQRDEF